jgi:hypothetical protein
MASTRNKNTLSNYRLDQCAISHYLDYNLYDHGASGNPVSIHLPGNGLGNIGVTGYTLAKNQVDIESFLRGTGTVNLVKGTFQEITPELICLTPINIYQNEPVILPKKLIVQPERPWPI